MVLNPNDPNTPLAPDMRIGQQLNSLDAPEMVGLGVNPYGMPVSSAPLFPGAPTAPPSTSPAFATMTAANAVPGVQAPNSTQGLGQVPDASAAPNNKLKDAAATAIKQGATDAAQALSGANAGMNNAMSKNDQMFDMIFSHQSHLNTPQMQATTPITVNSPSMITSDRTLKAAVKPGGRNVQTFLDQLYRTR